MEQGYNNTWGDINGFGSGGNTVFDQQDDWDLGATRQFDRDIKALEKESELYKKRATEFESKAKEKRNLRMGFQAALREMIHSNKIEMTSDEFYEQMDKDIKSFKKGAKIDDLAPIVPLG